MTIGENIKRARKAAGLTRKALAERLYLSVATLYGYETGKVRLPAELLVPIAEELNISVEDLLKED